MKCITKCTILFMMDYPDNKYFPWVSIFLKTLESLATSYTSDTLKALIEKYNAIIEKEDGQKVFWDFGVTRENKHVQNINNLLEQAGSLLMFWRKKDCIIQ